ncbi:MAG: cytochrome c [Dehalococcoidia bacterium]|nr:cytochrome c [Dehalococcoidia bacterium]
MSLIGLLIVGAIFFAACEGEDAEVVPTPVFHPTAAPAGDAPAAMSVPDAPAEVAPTVVPEAPSAAAADAANGEALFAAQGCSGCHSTGANSVVGPGLSGVGVRAETRVEGQSATDYLTMSIKSPNDFLVPDFPGIMPGNFGSSMSKTEISDLVAYLISIP